MPSRSQQQPHRRRPPSTLSQHVCSLLCPPPPPQILQSARPPALPPIQEIARPELKLAGLRIDAQQFSRSRLGYTTGAPGPPLQLPHRTLAGSLAAARGWGPALTSLHVPALLPPPPPGNLLCTPPPLAGLALVSSDEVVPAGEDKTRAISGYPAGSWINLVSWSPDGTHIAFTVRSPGAPPRAGSCPEAAPTWDRPQGWVSRGGALPRHLHDSL